MEQDPRLALDALAKEKGVDYLTLSKILGRNAAYIQQYIKRGTPKKLDEDDRAKLAAYFNVPESVLGGKASTSATNDNMTNIPRLSVGASAGHGALSDLEYESGKMAFDRSWLRDMGADPAKLRVISVQGESMLPILQHGDDILVNAGDRFEQGKPGIYVLRRDGELIVKDIEKEKEAGLIAIKSRNSDGGFASFANVPVDSVDILGRVLWAGRRLS